MIEEGLNKEEKIRWILKNVRARKESEKKQKSLTNINKLFNGRNNLYMTIVQWYLKPTKRYQRQTTQNINF